MLRLIESWVKSALLEVQEYVRLLAAGDRAPPSPGRSTCSDLVEQLDAIGVGSLTVVLLTGLFTGAVLALADRASRSISSARGRWSAAWSARRWSRSSARC